MQYGLESKALYNNAEALALRSRLKELNSNSEIKEILNNRFKDYPFIRKLSKIPHPKELLNNMEAAALVCEHIALDKRIIIVGDYDADGICATCIMLDFFDSIGYKKIDYAMPNRFKHGYGFSKALFHEMIEKYDDIALIITVDNGISSFEAANLCREHGIRFIITDHHTLEIDENGEHRIPYCDFMINPQQRECGFPFKDICGALVAWYFCCAIKILIENGILDSIIQDNSLSEDNTIISSLRGSGDSHNEAIHANANKQMYCFTNARNDGENNSNSSNDNKYSSNAINNNKIDSINNQPTTHTLEQNSKLYQQNIKNTCMKQLLPLASIAIISDVMPLNAINYTICDYGIYSLLNSDRAAFQVLSMQFKCLIDSQMLGFKFIPLLNAAGRLDSGILALDFLRAKSIDRAKHYLKRLKELNIYRKKLQEEVTKKAFSYLDNSKQNKHICFALGSNWHEGVLGIVAGKMADEFCKPSFVLTLHNGVCKGSARSYGDIDLIASVQKVGHLLNRYGGHVGAVGLEISLDNVDLFLQSFTPVFIKQDKEVDILGKLPISLISRQTFLDIESFSPYGNGNAMPRFYFELKILNCKNTNQGFLEFLLSDSSSNKRIKAMFFNTKYARDDFCPNDILQFSANITLDSMIFNARYRLKQAYCLRQIASIFYSENNMHAHNELMLIIDRIYGLYTQEI